MLVYDFAACQAAFMHHMKSHPDRSSRGPAGFTDDDARRCVGLRAAPAKPREVWPKLIGIPVEDSKLIDPIGRVLMLCVSEPRAVEMQTETLGKQPLFDRVRNRLGRGETFHLRPRSERTHYFLFCLVNFVPSSERLYINPF